MVHKIKLALVKFLEHHGNLKTILLVIKHNIYYKEEVELKKKKLNAIYLFSGSGQKGREIQILKGFFFDHQFRDAFAFRVATNFAAKVTKHGKTRATGSKRDQSPSLSIKNFAMLDLFWL